MNLRKKADSLPVFTVPSQHQHHQGKSGISNAVVPDTLIPAQTLGERFASWIRRNKYVIIGLAIAAAVIFFYVQNKVSVQNDMTYSFIETFSFWAISDVHLAKDYKVGADPSTFCTTGSGGAGRIGTYDCDVPSNGTLLTSALDFMLTRTRAGSYKTPTFVLYLGDSSTLYEEHPEGTETMEQIKENVVDVADRLTERFGRNVFPTLGNHDNHPSSRWPLPPNSPEYTSYLSWIADVWGSRWLGKAAIKTVKKGGYYYADVLPTLRLISLNTMLLAIDSGTDGNNNATTTDYAGQFAWLEKTIAKTPKTKRVVIFGHIPPYENVGALKVMWTPYALAQYKRILASYGHRISAQIFGHLHKDTFLNMKFGQVQAPYAMVVPSLTPRSSSGGVAKGAEACEGKNPGIRMYTLKYTTGEVIDYVQYYLNLTQANNNNGGGGDGGSGRLRWRKEYSFVEVYNVSGMEVTDFDAVVEGLEREGKFCEFARRMFVGQCPGGRLTKEFKSVLMCSLMNNVLDEAERYGYESCIESSSNVETCD